MKHEVLQAVALAAIVISGLGLSTQLHAQDVCTGTPSGRDVFSVGEVRTSILPQTTFRELNGPEWVLMDGRELRVETDLSPHLSPLTSIPDGRGRFLRMANNRVCGTLEGDEEAYKGCIAGHDPEGDRVLGHYQADSFAAHEHGEHSHGFRYVGARTSRPDGDDDDNDDTRAREHGRTGTTDPNRVSRSGGDETRPKNIAVNFYMKICSCRTDNCR